MTASIATSAGEAAGLAAGLEPYWMPFTPNRAFKKSPRLIDGAEGCWYRTADGRSVLDAIGGLWCVNAGHAASRVVEAIRRQAGELDYASSFKVGHSQAFELADRLASWLPDPLRHVFYCNSGSEAVETALKIAYAYQRARGEGQRFRLVGRERAYHGMGFGGLSVGGITKNRSVFGPLLPGVDHLRQTHEPEHQAFSRGQPAWGGHLADELEQIFKLHDPATFAAVIVEPVSGAGGVLIPPKGYLQRLREICDRYGVLLIFDEVITGFGRLGGAAFAAERLGVTPDLMCLAKGITNGAVPMGAVAAADHVYDAFMQRSDAEIELPHGYTASGHPLACAAALASLDTYEHDGVFVHASQVQHAFGDALHRFDHAPGVADVRELGLVGAIEFTPWPGKPGRRAAAIAEACWHKGVLIRAIGEAVVMSPPLIITESEIQQVVDAIGESLNEIQEP